MTIDNRDSSTIIDPKMIHILLVPGLIAVVDLLIRRSSNGDVTNR